MYLNVCDPEDKVELPVAHGDERLVAELEGGADVALVGEPGEEETREDGAQGESDEGVEYECDHGLRTVHVDHPQAVPDGLLGFHAANADKGKS